MPKILYKGATIIDGFNPQPSMGIDLLIAEEKIQRIGKINPDNEDNCHVVDVTGKFIIPGLINSHVHMIADPSLPNPLFQALEESDVISAFRGARNMETLLRSGVTYARDLGSPNYINIELRKARQKGLTSGAEFVTSGQCITTTGGHVWKISRECDGADEVRKAVREQLKAGADCIKIIITGGHCTPGVHPKTVQFTRAEVEAAVEIAHFAGKKIAAHTNGLEAIRIAIEAGVDSVEHCEFFPDDDKAEVQAVMVEMAKKGIFYVPTLSTWFKEYPQKHGYLGAIDLKVLDEPQLRQLDHIRPLHIKREYFSMGDIFDNAKRLYEAGVKIAMGTDAGIISLQFDKHPFEMKCMGLLGMTAMEVIQSATRNAAELLGISDEYGTLEQGKYADFVVLDESPLCSMDALYAINRVIKKGQQVC